MRKNVFGVVIFAGFLLAVSPAAAVIVLTLENPENGQDVSGITAISGWVFAQNDQLLTLKLRIDGITREDLTIPCCVPRQDVVDAAQGAPLNSGFGFLFSYGLLGVGPHFIGVEARAGSEIQIVDNAVTNVKPGGQSSDPLPLLFSFLDGLDLTDANMGLDGNEVIIAPVTAIDSGPGGSRKSTLRLLWTPNAQSFGIVDAASGPSFSTVQNIFTSSCATQKCHAGAVPQAGLDLSARSAFRNLVPVRSIEDPSHLRVNPGKATESYLYQKIIPGGTITGSPMPPAAPLSADQINIIANWINEGAPPPQ